MELVDIRKFQTVPKETTVSHPRIDFDDREITER
jgi:hypothetical protein